jgi:hypothetical protein
MSSFLIHLFNCSPGTLTIVTSTFDVYDITDDTEGFALLAEADKITLVVGVALPVDVE